MSKILQKAIFLDRDGVINKEKNYVHKISDFEFIPKVFDALKKAQNLGYKLIIITNQAGIGKGKFKERDLHVLHSYMINLLNRKGINIEAIYYCPHHPEALLKEYKINCNCRKPNPGMLLRAAKENFIDLKKSIIIGDKLSDYYAGKNAGLLYSILVKTGHKIPIEYLKKLKYVTNDLSSAINLIDSLVRA